MSRTKQAFDRFRVKYPEKECPPVENEDQRREMKAADGMEVWVDGPEILVAGSIPALRKITHISTFGLFAPKMSPTHPSGADLVQNCQAK